jgi:3-hydroxyisobutyrate dehydrogenase-like beta-hydroxyacid dehydrogenase
MPATAVFADLNTAAPEHKVRLAEEAGGAGISFADIAIMAPVPRAGVRSPVLVSGVGADRITDVWSELGIPISNVGPIAGGAAGLKMLRSVFMKGLAALVFEGVSAAEKVNAGEWMRAQMASELGVNGAALVDRLIGGTRMHAQRREREMHDVREYLGTLEVPTWMTEATTEWLHALAEDPYFPGGPLVS